MSWSQLVPTERPVNTGNQTAVAPSLLSADFARLADEIEAVYAAKPDMFRAPTLYEPSHILFAADPSDTDARLDANKKALAALATLKSSPRDFAHLAKELSDCPSRDMGARKRCYFRN